MPVLPAVPSTMVPPGFSAPDALGGAHDPERGAILHRLAGIEELRLAENLAAGLLGSAPEADERRVSDDVDDGAGDRH